jgi:hypothetical protein
MRTSDLPVLESTLVDAEYQSGWPVHPDELPSLNDRVVIVEHRPRRDVWDADRVAWQRELAARVRKADRTPGVPLTVEDYPQLQKPTRPNKPKPRDPTPRVTPAAEARVANPNLERLLQPTVHYISDQCGAVGCSRRASYRVEKSESLWFLSCAVHRSEAETVWPGESQTIPLRPRA